MYKGYQEELFPNPWGVNVGFKHLQEKLDELVPSQWVGLKILCQKTKSREVQSCFKCEPMTFSIMVLVIRDNSSKEFLVGLST